MLVHQPLLDATGASHARSSCRDLIRRRMALPCTKSSQENMCVYTGGHVQATALASTQPHVSLTKAGRMAKGLYCRQSGVDSKCEWQLRMLPTRKGHMRASHFQAYHSFESHHTQVPSLQFWAPHMSDSHAPSPHNAHCRQTHR